MDREQAKFVLRSFRPEGADAADGDFAEALGMASTDRELGKWFADERAFDAMFSKALGSMAVPARLHQRIFEAAEGNFDGVPQIDGQADAGMIGALASIQPPAALRCELLAAMERTKSGKSTSRWRRVAWPLAAAAGIALAFLLTQPVKQISAPVAVVPAVASDPPDTVPVDAVQASFIRTFESPLYEVEGEHPKGYEQLVQVLEKKKLPCPKCLPPGLTGVQSLGCRELMIGGKRGSLVCYDEPVNGRVHLVIFKREDVCGCAHLPTRENPQISQQGPWSVARWVDEEHVFVMLGSRPMDKLAGLF